MNYKRLKIPEVEDWIWVNDERYSSIYQLRRHIYIFIYLIYIFDISLGKEGNNLIYIIYIYIFFLVGMWRAPSIISLNKLKVEVWRTGYVTCQSPSLLSQPYWHTYIYLFIYTWKLFKKLLKTIYWREVREDISAKKKKKKRERDGSIRVGGVFVIKWKVLMVSLMLFGSGKILMEIGSIFLLLNIC